MSALKRLLLPLVIALVAAGCVQSPTEPSDYEAYSQTDLVVGTGGTASYSLTAYVTYTGWLYDATKADRKGLQFDSNVGGTPFSFTLGAGRVIRGWEQGVIGMNVGGIRRLVIPPSLAYGKNRVGKIPANSTLIFEIELTSVQ